MALIIARTRSFSRRANSSHAWRVNSAVSVNPQSSSMRHIGPSWVRDFTIPGSQFLALADTVSTLFSRRTSSALMQTNASVAPLGKSLAAAISRASPTATVTSSSSACRTRTRWTVSIATIFAIAGVNGRRKTSSIDACCTIRPSFTMATWSPMVAQDKVPKSPRRFEILRRFQNYPSLFHSRIGIKRHLTPKRRCSR